MITSQQSLWNAWHPYYPFAFKPNCLFDFQRLMNCLSSNKKSDLNDCMDMYAKLNLCLIDNGLPLKKQLKSKANGN